MTWHVSHDFVAALPHMAVIGISLGGPSYPYLSNVVYAPTVERPEAFDGKFVYILFDEPGSWEPWAQALWWKHTPVMRLLNVRTAQIANVFKRDKQWKFERLL